MKRVPTPDRPREKMERCGAGALGDNELVAIVLAHGTREAGALDLANDILDRAGGLHGLPRLATRDLRQLRGVGGAKAAQVVAAIELGRRTLVRRPPARAQLAGPAEVAGYLLPLYGSRPVEHFGLVLLDTKHRVLRTTIISVGSIDTSIANPREIFREAAAADAAAVVLFHNHPSGDPTPSRDDVSLTRRLVEAGQLMGVPVVDHVILAEAAYYSFQESGRLADMILAYAAPAKSP